MKDHWKHLCQESLENYPICAMGGYNNLADYKTASATSVFILEHEGLIQTERFKLLVTRTTTTPWHF